MTNEEFKTFATDLVDMALVLVLIFTAAGILVRSWEDERIRMMRSL